MSSQERFRQPFFSDGEVVPDILLEGDKSLSRKAKGKNKSRRHQRQWQPFVAEAERQVGISTLPIGSFASTPVQGQPVDLVNTKHGETEQNQNKSMKSFFDNTCEMEKQTSYYQDTNSEKQGPYHKLKETEAHYHNGHNGQNGYAIDVVKKPVGYHNVSPHDTSYVQQDIKGQNSTVMLKTLAGYSGKTSPAGSVHSDADSKSVSSTQSEQLKSVLKGMGLLPQTVTEERPRKAYAFSRHVCSPDPSSIPVPGLRQ